MITKRLNVFETNSSSSHSITINTIDEDWDTIIPNEEGIIYLNGGEFGWGYEEITDALTKANYCAVDFKENDNLLEKLSSVIKDFTRANEVIIDLSWTSSYIDHQSDGTVRYEYLSDEDLKYFIFNKKSILIIDNDNH